jgi:chromate reductase, NAD(P)H dehydrogenase (quinone)
MAPRWCARNSRADAIEFLAISGSLRRGSSNTAALEALRLLAPSDLSIRPYGGLATLPAFNPDCEDDPPAPVKELRALVRAADALIISSPEYARGLAGSLKNLLDWLVGGPEFAGKRVVLINTSPRAEQAQAQLRLIVGTMAGQIVEEACVTLPLLGRALTAAEIAADPALAKPLRQVLEATIRAVGA